MGYIVDLTVIHNELFRSDGDVLVGDVLSVMDRYKSDRRSAIHGKIRDFVTKTAKESYVRNPQLANQRFLQETTDLINKYCRNS